MSSKQQTTAITLAIILVLVWLLVRTTYSYEPFMDSSFLRIRTNNWTGHTNLQVLDLPNGRWVDKR